MVRKTRSPGRSHGCARFNQCGRNVSGGVHLASATKCPLAPGERERRFASASARLTPRRIAGRMPFGVLRHEAALPWAQDRRIAKKETTGSQARRAGHTRSVISQRLCEKLLAPFLFRPFRARTGGSRPPRAASAVRRTCPGLCSHALL